MRKEGLNMIVKKILCKYFSNGEADRKVTISSLSIRIIALVSAFVLNIYVYRYTIPAIILSETVENTPHAFKAMLGSFGIVLDIYVLIYVAMEVYNYLDTVVITRYERKD